MYAVTLVQLTPSDILIPYNPGLLESVLISLGLTSFRCVWKVSEGRDSNDTFGEIG